MRNFLRDCFRWLVGSLEPERAYSEQLRTRPKLSDDEFYETFYAHTGIPKSPLGGSTADEVQITVKRESDGFLYVRGLVETTERKNEILNALQSVRQNPAVRIELDTVAEAVAKQKNQPSRTPDKIEDFKTETLTTAAENDLVEHFGNEAEAKRFASNTVRRSSQAINYVYAMRRLARQFSAAELKTLSPEAKSKWLGLIVSYARNFKAESEGLSRELGNVFNAPNVSGSANVAVNSIDDLPRAIEMLVSLASNNDRVIRSALTISAGIASISSCHTYCARLLLKPTPAGNPCRRCWCT